MTKLSEPKIQGKLISSDKKTEIFEITSDVRNYNLTFSPGWQETYQLSYCDTVDGEYQKLSEEYRLEPGKTVYFKVEFSEETDKNRQLHFNFSSEFYPRIRTAIYGYILEYSPSENGFDIIPQIVVA